RRVLSFFWITEEHRTFDLERRHRGRRRFGGRRGRHGGRLFRSVEREDRLRLTLKRGLDQKIERRLAAGLFTRIRLSRIGGGNERRLRVRLGHTDDSRG